MLHKARHRRVFSAPGLKTAAYYIPDLRLGLSELPGGGGGRAGGGGW